MFFHYHLVPSALLPHPPITSVVCRLIHKGINADHVYLQEMKLKSCEGVGGINCKKKKKGLYHECSPWELWKCVLSDCDVKSIVSGKQSTSVWLSVSDLSQVLMHIKICLISQLHSRSHSITVFYKIKENYSKYTGLFTITLSVSYYISIHDEHSSSYTFEYL